MQGKETVYLAGKITGDPFYRSKFYEAQKKLEAGGFVVVNPAILPSEGFSWEAYMRMSSAMLDECDAACFLPDWIDSKGAMYEFGRATAQGKRVFLFAAWVTEQENKIPEKIITDKKTGKIAFRCLMCEKISVFPERTSDGRSCEHCGGHVTPIGYAKVGKQNGK